MTPSPTDEALARGIRLVTEAGVGAVGFLGEARDDPRLAEARGCFEAARRGGSPEGCARLATLLREGLGGPRDAARARRLYRESLDAAGDGGIDPAVIAALGMMLAEGEGGARDVAAARRYLSVAARYGSVTATCGLMDLPPADPPDPPWAIAVPDTRRGRHRVANEDAFRAIPEIGLFAVADGFGGPAAAALALAVFVDAVAESGRLDHAARCADAALRGDTSLRGAGVELAALRVADGSARAVRVGNVGVWRAPGFAPIAHGAWDHAGRVLGAGPDLALREEVVSAEPGALFVLGTDAIHRLREPSMGGARSLADLARTLLDAADPDDDATVLCVAVPAPG